MSSPRAPEREAGRPGASLLSFLRSGPGERTVLDGWTAAALHEEAARRGRTLAEQGVAGEVVALQAGNGEAWVLGLLSLLAAGARPLLVPAEAPEAERERLLHAAGGSRRLAGEALASPAAPGGAPPAAAGDGTVLVPTSGSTGRSEIVARSQASLIDEGLRYRATLPLEPGARVLVPVPMSHAYGLAWMVAALVSGAHLCPLPPAGLGAIEAQLERGASAIALVPTLARLLATRRIRRRAEQRTDPPGVAMVGAGAVDEALESAFRRAFGLGTARNYGSTETGTLCAGLPELPPRCVGRPLPGVACRVAGDAGAPCSPGVAGDVEVRLEGQGEWRATGDLGSLDGAGRLHLLGRRSSAVRRGGRWVAPLEVEAVLREHPSVRDVHVRGRRGRHDGEEVLLAHVEVSDPDLERADLAAFAAGQLAPYKVPDRIHLTGRLARTPSGKPAGGHRYRLAGPDVVTAAARDYKRSELLFALHDLGALRLLEEGADPEDLAERLGLSASELAWTLEVAADLGLVVAEPDGDGGYPGAGAGRGGGRERPSTDAAPYVELESRLSRTLVTREAIAAALRDGEGRRAFDRAEADPALAAAYRDAMHGAQTAPRTRLGVRLARPAAGERWLEVSSGAGRYLPAVVGATEGCHGDLLPVGRLSGGDAPALAALAAQGRVRVDPDPPARAYDACVVSGAIHGPAPADDLAWLLERLRPGGRLLVDDVFLPAGAGAGAELGLDWLTHGHRSWPTAGALAAGLSRAGGTVVTDRRLRSSPCHLVLAREDR